MALRRNSPIPLYIQIKEYIRQKIDSGEFDSHTRLPSERQLAIQFDVNRLTVTKALKELEQENLVYTQIGKGTYVTSRKRIQQELSVLTSFTEDMSHQHKRVTSQVLTCEVIPIYEREVLEALDLSAGDMVFFLERLRMADSVAIALEKAHIPHILCANIESRYDFAQQSLYHVLRADYHIQLTTAQQLVEARLATAREAQLLESEINDAVLGFTRTSFNQHNQPIEYVKSTYPGDRYTLQIELKPSGATMSTSEVKDE